MKRNKYTYLFVLQGNYGVHGWEDLCAETSYHEARARQREYHENEGGTYRIIKRREPNNAENRRCGQCDNCKKLERVRRRVLACCNPPFSHADQGVVNLWNKELECLPCTDEVSA